jgi:pimeloyl-ACP methyl ester carboxylesterase
MMAFDGTAVANSIRCPVLIMSGERDFVTPQNYQRELHHNIAGSEFVSIPYGSHCCQLDFPDFVNLKIQKFIDSHS